MNRDKSNSNSIGRRGGKASLQETSSQMKLQAKSTMNTERFNRPTDICNFNHKSNIPRLTFGKINRENKQPPELRDHFD